MRGHPRLGSVPTSLLKNIFILPSPQVMNDLFDRPVIILETDRNKSDDGHATAHPSRNLLSPALSRTKYIDALVSQLTRSKIQVRDATIHDSLNLSSIHNPMFL